MLNCNLKLNKATENALKGISKEYKIWLTCEDDGDCKIIVSVLVGNTWYTASDELYDGTICEIVEGINECLRIIKENLEFITKPIKELAKIKTPCENKYPRLSLSEFSEKLRIYLIERGYSVVQFASMIGCSDSSVCDYKNGRRMPGTSIYDRIMDFLEGKL
jgi:hypothetical protein